MNWIDLVATLAVLQFIVFGLLVGAARGRYGVHAPAVTGHEMFERAYRVQMNTLELLVALLPALYLAARHWPAGWVAAAGGVYLVGRMVYRRAYLRDPGSRSLGFGLSAFPILALLGATLVGLVTGR
ncbi:MAPEG family protein [Leptothrix discophora]|uniref:MAPEG family protein n=1 Tax=Leptothrix discophora TaxID=89 RepID=A0ABT9G8A2_LEPDI|nr:MAPEG family protein [Leptothrix discophora]MDP4302728.1 MAPEG family protein [Leptothrix discophora]